MEAIEFKTIIHNGTVVIPPEYSPQWEGKAIRVIVLNDSELLSEPVEKPKQATFNAISLNTQGFDFNREEANVR
ncbi:hypothetical protein G7B40_005460 [Aetokthonos hydrillicola Thurmond2011]|jgi:hypothetical protein|uniref:Uncharacterized protein n=1 Tax=Aetokthonos hydrillicola Thurmond2011 TaxID=2712845 RepID=A0AAP5M959_9CYAN|nr:hypothetical protein [Aetokthonos hydrillicola]MBO3457308.1 hypothetical protein [Aetokthonos hydrillicola CCALA 1050]MBW4586654.1 hypothetical protein [Aetokthonos hydrillicola CCALA 1050]MDR9894019.1 hypothetical protein [Aetokthonos hydrillicola Thurmond2011]